MGCDLFWQAHALVLGLGTTALKQLHTGRPTVEADYSSQFP